MQSDQPNAIPDLTLPTRVGGYARGHETRELILRKALAILVEEGYRAMTMRRVAAACGMKFGNLTYHFRTREDLVRDLLDAVARSYETQLQAIAGSTTPAEERLRLMCDLLLGDIRSRRTTRLFPELWAASSHDSLVQENLRVLYARVRAPFVAIIGELRHDLPEPDRDLLALFLMSSIGGLIVPAGLELPLESEMPRMWQIALRSLLSLVCTISENEVTPLAGS